MIDFNSIWNEKCMEYYLEKQEEFRDKYVYTFDTFIVSQIAQGRECPKSVFYDKIGEASKETIEVVKKKLKGDMVHDFVCKILGYTPYTAKPKYIETLDVTDANEFHWRYKIIENLKSEGINIPNKIRVLGHYDAIINNTAIELKITDWSLRALKKAENSETSIRLKLMFMFQGLEYVWLGENEGINDYWIVQMQPNLNIVNEFGGNPRTNNVEKEVIEIIFRILNKEANLCWKCKNCGYNYICPEYQEAIKKVKIDVPTIFRKTERNGEPKFNIFGRKVI